MPNLIDYQILDNLTDLPFTKFDSDVNYARCNEPLQGAEVLRYYDEPFKVLNAKYVNLNGSRTFARQNLRAACIILQYLNPNITQAQLRIWASEKIRRYISDTKLEIKALEAKDIVASVFGNEISLEHITTNTSTIWKSKYPINNPYHRVSESRKYLSHLINERRSFSLKCYNKIQSGNSIQKFISAYGLVSEQYGSVSMQDIAEVTKMNIGSVRRVKSKIDKISTDLNNPYPSIKNKKYVDTQRRIMNAGDEIHYLELLKITKSRVSVKAESSRPTVDNHWKDVGDYFNVLNEQLIDKQ
jgi:hypothetical protein